jgi:surface polysaccharide O-acyltransferase-like enzyme
VLVILLHAAIEPVQVIDEMSSANVTLWWTVNVYSAIARPAVPLFVMLTGALLLQPSKVTEPIGQFFRKRMKRIALPFIFWGIVYFIWRFYVNQEVVSYEQIVTGILSGPYNHFWFLYMLIGLYLVTPILRIVITHSEWITIRYFFFIWLLGTAITPLITLSGSFRLHDSVFIFTGWIGYFFFGAYVQKIRLHSWILYITLFFGIIGTILGTYMVTGVLGGRQGQLINDPCSICAIAASITLFLLLTNLSPVDYRSQRVSIGKLIKYISQNTLAIYLLHVIVMEIFQKGYIGVKISLSTLNPIIEVPLITAVTLFSCLGLIYVLKKIPYVKKIIG